MNDQKTTIQALKERTREVIEAREWNQFHNAKNLSMQIAAEASELMEHFLWVDGNTSSELMKTNGEEIEHEIADIVIGVLCLCNRYNIDLATIFEKKMQINEKRYPVEKAKGVWTKYTKL